MTTNPIAEAIEIYADTTKDLLSKWRSYGSQVTTNLDSPPYKADTAATDLGAGVSLSIQTGARLCLMIWNAFATLAADYTDEVRVMDFSTQYKGATLGWDERLNRGFGDVIPDKQVKIIPSKLGDDQQAFRVRVDTMDCRSGVYEGHVRATASDGQTELLFVRVNVPPTHP